MRRKLKWVSTIVVVVLIATILAVLLPIGISISGEGLLSIGLSRVYASSSGIQCYPEVAATQAVAPENSDNWVSATNIFSNDGAYSYITAATYDSPDISYRIKATAFNFSSIPDGASIDGILVEIDRYCIVDRYGRDYRVQLLDASGALVGGNKADTVNNWPTASTVKSYGGISDTWGASLTVAMLKSLSFGVVLSVQATSANADIYVDFVCMTVYYSQVSIQQAGISFIGNTSSTGNNPTSGTFTLNSISWQADDVAVFWWYTRVATKTFTLDDAKITQKQQAYDDADGYAGRIFIGYRVLQAGDTTFGWTSSSSSNATTIWGTSVFRGVDTTGDPFEAESGVPERWLNTEDPNPPAVVTVTDSAWAVPIFGKQNDYSSITVPTNYTTAGSNVSSDGNDASAGIAYREIASHGSENPGKWDLAGGGTSDDGYTWTGALKPEVGVADISINYSSVAFGVVAVNSTYWSNGLEPTWVLVDGDAYFTITNNGDPCSITVVATNFTSSGASWILDSSVGINHVVLTAFKEGDDYDEGVTITTSPLLFISGLTTNIDWELKLETGTFTDWYEKTSIITLSATLD